MCSSPSRRCLHVRRFVVPPGQNLPPGTVGMVPDMEVGGRRIEDRGGGRNARPAGTEYP